MKTITLTDEQFDNLFNYLDEKVNYIVDKSIDYQDSEILDEWEDLIEVYDIIEDTTKIVNMIWTICFMTMSFVQSMKRMKHLLILTIQEASINVSITILNQRD